MYAIVNISGKQYRVAKGDRIRVDLLDAKGPGEKGEAGAQVTFKDVLLIGGEGGVKVGTPVVAGASVTATVARHGKGPKLWAFKRKRRKGFHKIRGHRQPFTELEINGISG
ncbi:MAG: 50S ribosomal protein L21 [Myxococcota bacterium]